MDSPPIQSAGIEQVLRPAEREETLSPPGAVETPDHGALLNIHVHRFWTESDAGPIGLTQTEFTVLLLHSGIRHHYGLPPGSQASPAQMEAFWRGLHLRELALAHACALGREKAWQIFMAEYRAPLKQAAVAITRSSSLGEELADSLYSELFGLVERDGQRRSPLNSYSGRGSLMGWLRTTLAQRFVDHHRRTHREAPLETEDDVAAESTATPSEETLTRLRAALSAAIRSIEPEARFLLVSWFLDGRTLLQIACVLRVHEATVSRKIKRLTEKLHKDLRRNLQAGGLSRRAAQEALGTDPRDLDIHVRNLLQTSQPSAFQEEGRQHGGMHP